MQLNKAMKNLDGETIKELEALSAEELKQRIVQANQSMDQAERELEENPEYQNLKESLKAVTAGLKELRKRQNSVITVALHSLEAAGK